LNYGGTATSLRCADAMNTNESLTQHPHRIFQPFERQGIHAVADQLLNDADALAVLP
jgi:hypothetical protein